MSAEVREAIYNPSTRTWVTGDVLAGPGPEDCRDVRCSRVNGRCVGMHCAKCGEPCGSQGHLCEHVTPEEDHKP